MAVTLEAVRKAALALPGTSEEPHHNLGSFRVGGSIFVTVPPGGQLLHIFLPPEAREHALAMDPEFLEPLVWGRKAVGVRVTLPRANPGVVRHLIQQAYEFKAAAASKTSAVSRKQRARPSARRPTNAA